MSPLSLANFVIQKYYQSKLKFNGVCSRNNLRCGIHSISMSTNQ